MNVIIKTGFERIIHNIIFQPETIPKGIKLVKAEHVYNVQEHRRDGISFLIEAQVIRQTSVTSPPYRTKLHINAVRLVTNVSCTCIYSMSGKCKHVAALIDYINSKYSLSKTDHEQQWGKPSAREFAKEKYSKGRYFSEMFPPVDKRPIKVHHLDIANVLASCSPLKILMDKEKENNNTRTIKNSMEDLLKAVEINLDKEECERCVNTLLSLAENKEVYASSQKLENSQHMFYKENIIISCENVVKLCCDTLEQSRSDKWFQARRLRVSASKSAHSIKSRVKKSVESLVQDMLNPKKIDNSSTRYGNDYENDARKAYEVMFGVKVQKVGVIVSQFQCWLCALPDGIVFEDNKVTKVLEIKCPSFCRTKTIVDFHAKVCNVKYLQLEHGQVILIKSAMYCMQCQMLMYLTGLDICDLFIYTSVKNGSVCVQVKRDKSLIKFVVLKCEDFYFKYYLAELHKKLIKEKQKNLREVLKPIN